MLFSEFVILHDDVVTGYYWQMIICDWNCTTDFEVRQLHNLKMAAQPHLPQMLGSEGMQVQKNAHKGRNIAVFTSGGDSQGIILYIIKNE